MIVDQIWTGNRLRNFNYLVICPETGEALAIDPLDYQSCLARAKEQGWQIRQVLNTHEHGDHTGGNKKVIAATGAKLLAHGKARIHGVDQGLSAGDIVHVGKTVELLVLDTPGHTMTHVCLLSQTETPCLFSGDTLFNAGAGNCHNGGHPEQLYDTFAKQLERLADSTRLYPGHDYISTNLRFTLDREPGNTIAKKMQNQLRDQDPANAYVSTIALEKQINTFMRLTEQEIIDRLRLAIPDFPKVPGPRDVFLALRALRNAW